MKHLVLAAVAAAALAACASMGRDGIMAERSVASMPDGSAAAALPGAAMPTQADAYLRVAGESDIFEVTSSQIALMRTQNPEVRAYATQLIDHHTMTTNTTLSAARAGGVTPPPAVLGAQKRALIQQLESRTGAAFDQLYIQQQVPAHEEALALHANYARDGDVAPLRATAASAVPIVTAHLNAARALQARLGGVTGLR
jgi:putative membrane protein